MALPSPPSPQLPPPAESPEPHQFGRTFALHVSALAIVGLVLTIVVPAVARIFNEFDAELPRSTILLIDISTGWRDYWRVLLSLEFMNRRYLLFPAALLPAYFVALYAVSRSNRTALRIWTMGIVIGLILFLAWSTAALTLPFVAMTRLS